MDSRTHRTPDRGESLVTAFDCIVYLTFSDKLQKQPHTMELRTAFDDMQTVRATLLIACECFLRFHFEIGATAVWHLAEVAPAHDRINERRMVKHFHWSTGSAATGRGSARDQWARNRLAKGKGQFTINAEPANPKCKWLRSGKEI